MSVLMLAMTPSLSLVVALSNASAGGGLGSDTVLLQSLSSITSSTIKGGDNADSIQTTSGLLSTSIVNGNKGADTIVISTTASSNGSVGGGLGHDTIELTTTAGVTWINAGGGKDTITLVAEAAVGTVAGGGLADTIAFSGAFDGGVIYGDGVGVLTGGSGTGGTADGADKIGLTAFNIDGATTIAGGGGSDSVTIDSADGGVTSTAVTMQIPSTLLISAPLPLSTVVLELTPSSSQPQQPRP